jgi:hypothetical protein
VHLFNNEHILTLQYFSNYFAHPPSQTVGKIDLPLDDELVEVEVEVDPVHRSLNDAVQDYQRQSIAKQSQKKCTDLNQMGISLVNYPKIIQVHFLVSQVIEFNRSNSSII